MKILGVILLLLVGFLGGLQVDRPTLGGIVDSDNESANYTELEPFWIPWEDKLEIKKWVKATGIPDREGIPEVYDCDDFAIDLYLAGHSDNRCIGLLVLKYKEGGHMLNFTIMGNHVYRIEPQTGAMRHISILDKVKPSKDLFR